MPNTTANHAITYTNPWLPCYNYYKFGKGTKVARARKSDFSLYFFRSLHNSSSIPWFVWELLHMQCVGNAESSSAVKFSVSNQHRKGGELIREMRQFLSRLRPPFHIEAWPYCHLSVGGWKPSARRRRAQGGEMLPTLAVGWRASASDVRVSRSMPVLFYRGHISTLLQRICIKLSIQRFFKGLGTFVFFFFLWKFCM